MTGALKPAATQALTINTLYFTSKYDPPFETNLYVETLAEAGLAYDNIAVVPVIQDQKITIPFNVDSAITNGAVSTVTAEISSKIYDVDSAAAIAVGGGDRVQIVGAAGLILGETRVTSRSGVRITLRDSFTGVVSIKLMMGYAAACIGTTVWEWFPMNVLKVAGDNYPVILNVIVE